MRNKWRELRDRQNDQITCVHSYGCGTKTLSESRVVGERDKGTSCGLKDDMTMTGKREGSLIESAKGIDMRRPMNAVTA